jgi:hypothetical protein
VDESGFIQVLSTLETNPKGTPETDTPKPAVKLTHQPTRLNGGMVAHPGFESSPFYADEPSLEPPIKASPKAAPQTPEWPLPHEVALLQVFGYNPALTEKPQGGAQPTSTHQGVPPSPVKKALYNIETLPKTAFPTDLAAQPKLNFPKTPYTPSKHPALMAAAFTPFSTAGTVLLAPSVPMPPNATPPGDMPNMDEGAGAPSPTRFKGKGPHTRMAAADDALSNPHAALKHPSTEPHTHLDIAQHGPMTDSLSPQTRAENIAVMLNVADAFRAHVQRRHTHFRIPVRHETLGDVEVHLRMERDQSVTAAFLTNSDTMMRLLNNHKWHLEEILTKAGLTCTPDNFRVIRH